MKSHQITHFWTRTHAVVFVVVLGALLSAAVAETVHQACLPSDPSMNGTYEIFRGQDVIWQIPATPKAVLFLAHGGHLNPLSFFDKGPGCPQCYGRPEDRMAVLNALQEGYAVLTLKSIGITWSEVTEVIPGDDFDIVIDLLKTWTTRESLDGLPLVGWGHSAGASFLSTLALFVPIRSLILMCDAGELKSLRKAVPGLYPPTFFAFLNNNLTDTYPTTDAIRSSEAVLLERGVRVSEKIVLATPLTPSIFAERIHCISSEVSTGIYEALKSDGSWLDENDYLAKNPFVDDWRPVVLNSHGLPYCVEFEEICLAEHVDQVLKVAQAIHSFMRDANVEIFAWMNLAIGLETM